MIEIKLSPNDQKDILEMLNYALVKKQEDTLLLDGKSKWSDKKYWQLRIPQLVSLIKGRKIYDTVYQSSLGNLVGDIERGLGNDSNY